MDAWRMTPGSRMLYQDWSGQNLTGGGNFYFCGFLLELNHLDFSSPFPLTLAQVFTDFSTESESPLPRLPSQFSGLYSRSARNGVIQLWPTGSYYASIYQAPAKSSALHKTPGGCPEESGFKEFSV